MMKALSRFAMAATLSSVLTAYRRLPTWLREKTMEDATIARVVLAASKSFLPIISKKGMSVARKSGRTGGAGNSREL